MRLPLFPQEQGEPPSRRTTQTPQKDETPQETERASSSSTSRHNWKPELGRLYKPTGTSISKESTTRSLQDNFSGSNLSFTCLQRSHRDYFSGSPSGLLNKNWTLTGPYREARTAVSERSGPAQTLPRAALPDVRLDVGAEPPEAAATSRIPRAERPPVVLEIPAAFQSRLSLADTRTCPAKDPGLPGEVTRDRGPALLLLHAVPEATFYSRQVVRVAAPLCEPKKFLTRPRFPALQQSPRKETLTASPDPSVW